MPISKISMNEKQSFRSILKTTGLFGGVEVLKILVNVFQTTIVAVILGPVGIGIQNMFTTMLYMLTSFFGLGLQTSAVREVARANATNDEITISKTIITLRRWINTTAIIGAVFMISFAKPLSQLTFDTPKYSLFIIFLSLALIFTVLSNGQTALIKGLRRLKDLAKVSLCGSIISLIVSIPIFYFWGENGIVPVIIISAFCVLICSYVYAKKVVVKNVDISYKESVVRGKEMVKIGFFLMLSTFLAQLSSYSINGYISHVGNFADVGYYRAGYLITTHYVGLIFTAMGADFLPRLTEANEKANQMSEVVHAQSLVALLIITPLLTFLFPLIKIIISILYSTEFYVIENYISWAALGLLSRLCVWCLSYILLAKGFSVRYFVSELFANLTNVLFCIWGYKWFNIQGLGIAFCLNNIICLLFNYVIVIRSCDFRYNNRFWSRFMLANLLLIVLFLFHRFFNNLWGNIVLLVVSLIVTLYCLKILKKKSEFSLRTFFKKKN